MLDQIAAHADVTAQTVIRRFGSEDGIIWALAPLHEARVQVQRSDAPVGDVAGAVANLLEHYEAEGDLMMHLLRRPSGRGCWLTL